MNVTMQTRRGFLAGAAMTVASGKSASRPDILFAIADDCSWPDRYPAGVDTHTANGYRDIDPGPAKDYMMTHRDEAAVANLFELGFGKRPAEELYDLRNDRQELRNVATDPVLADIKARLSAQLDQQA